MTSVKDIKIAEVNVWQSYVNGTRWLTNIVLLVIIYFEPLWGSLMAGTWLLYRKLTTNRWL